MWLLPVFVKYFIVSNSCTGKHRVESIACCTGKHRHEPKLMASSSSRTRMTSSSSRRICGFEEDTNSAYDGIRCNCQQLVRIWHSNTTNNPGRRFMRCPNYKDPDKCCNYFQWIDPKPTRMSIGGSMNDELETHAVQQCQDDGMLNYTKDFKKCLEDSARNQKLLLLYSRVIVLLLGIVLVLLVVLVKICM